jgi:signal transduction histidine kinase/CHASE3 domain sensor protein
MSDHFSSQETQRASGLSIGVRINLVLLLGLMLLAGVWWVSDASIRELLQNARAESQVVEELRQLELLGLQLRSVELSHQRYLIEGDPRAMEEFEQRARLLLPALARLREQLQDARLKNRTDALRELLNRRLDFFRASMKTRSPSDVRAARDAMRDSVGLSLSREIQSEFEVFRRLQLSTLEQRRAETGTNADNSSYLILWSTLFAATLLLWAIVVIQRFHHRRNADVQALRDSQAGLIAIADAVPAMIAVFDGGLRCRFHNRAVRLWFDRDATQLDGVALRALLDEAAYSVVRPHIERALAGTASRLEFLHQRPGKAAASLIADFIPRLDTKGEFSGCYALLSDVTQLREVDRLKSQFISVISHELRTPMTSIRGSLGLLAGGVVGALPDKARELVDIARINCDRLVRLVNDILDSERISTGRLAFNMQPTTIRALVDRAVEAIQGYAAGFGVRVFVRQHTVPMPPIPELKVDPDRIEQVLSNLLANACKFTAPGSDVEVVLLLEPECLRIEVLDRGPGVDESFRPLIFERFTQSDSRDARLKGGSGLGLAISRAIVERHRGRIGLRTREGGGSVFWFELPLPEAGARTTETAAVRTRVAGGADHAG